MTSLRDAATMALNALEGGADSWQRVGPAIDAIKSALAEPVQEPVAALLRAAGRVLQAYDDGYLEPDDETVQGSLAVDALRKAWGAFAPARIQGGQQ